MLPVALTDKRHYPDLASCWWLRDHDEAYEGLAIVRHIMTTRQYLYRAPEWAISPPW
jgi:hypothetical protein